MNEELNSCSSNNELSFIYIESKGKRRLLNLVMMNRQGSESVNRIRSSYTMNLVSRHGLLNGAYLTRDVNHVAQSKEKLMIITIQWPLH